MRILICSLNNRLIFLNNIFLSFFPIHYLCRFKKKELVAMFVKQNCIPVKVKTRVF